MFNFVLMGCFLFSLLKTSIVWNQKRTPKLWSTFLMGKWRNMVTSEKSRVCGFFSDIRQLWFDTLDNPELWNQQKQTHKHNIKNIVKSWILTASIPIYNIWYTNHPGVWWWWREHCIFPWENQFRFGEHICSRWLTWWAYVLTN